MCACQWHLDQHTSYVRCLLHPLHSRLSTQSPLCSFKDDPPFHTDLLADRHWWIDRPTLLICFLLFFLPPPSCSNTQTQIPAAPVMPVTFLISSELLSMPAVKRFSVSYARHPTNGMSAFFFSTLLQFSSYLAWPFCGKTFSMFSVLGGVTCGYITYIISDFLFFLFCLPVHTFGVCVLFCFLLMLSALHL